MEKDTVVSGKLQSPQSDNPDRWNRKMSKISTEPIRVGPTNESAGPGKVQYVGPSELVPGRISAGNAQATPQGQTGKMGSGANAYPRGSSSPQVGGGKPGKQTKGWGAQTKREYQG